MSEFASLDPEFPEIAPASGPSAGFEFSTPEKPVLPSRPWGPWATIGWTFLCIVMLFGAQIAGAIIFLLFTYFTTGSAKIEDIATNGNLLAFATLELVVQENWLK